MSATDAYHTAREREGRLLTDEVVAGLPRTGRSTPHAAEWRIRERSMHRLLKDLGRSGRGLSILDIGCGNGWLSAQLQRHGHEVVAIDTHSPELEQALRVFGSSGVDWRIADPFDLHFPAATFDRIVLAASLQYFKEPLVLFAHLRPWLKPGGEVHVVDTVLYGSEADARSARERSQAYYASLGAVQMAQHYHHHTLDELTTSSKARILSAPSRWDWSSGFPRSMRDPFHHIAIPA